MPRAVEGDGVKYFYIQDVAVLPDYQGQEGGKAILVRTLRQHACPPGAPSVKSFANWLRARR
ncbi:hypothetical protein GCM10011577_33010 [Pseudarthrobacter polychromogenes]|uniref:N-acetyltransferase domain-containing protein n=1 Tax=Pseudarthrobacter polychromogenes TaxID=1676 RepID=A0ABQ1XXQ7_9MICC|nr:hypothetical protein GCM10011577_33010 [Pseudarthrobacter polychromogenes]